MRSKTYARMLLAALPVLLAGPASADEGQWTLTGAGWRSGSIDHVRQLPLEGSAIGLVRQGRYLYVSTARSFSIYDVKTPESPSLLSTVQLGVHALNEHPQTNGRILILSNDLGLLPRTLEVWDVKDKASPRKLASFPHGGTDHTWACVLGCAFAYGSSGGIVSLADPTAPVKVGDWRNVTSPRPARFHGIDEVAPGWILTASEPTVLLDARDPASPVQAATVDPPASFGGPANRRSIPSYAHWPQERGERFALETIETPFSGPCSAGSGGLVTFDTSGYETTGKFSVADVYRLTNGTFTDGNPPVTAVGCSAFGLAEGPDWNKDRLVAMAAMEHGVRLLRIGLDGSISEAGGFMAHGTEAAYPVWGSRGVLYVADVARGLDVYRVR